MCVAFLLFTDLLNKWYSTALLYNFCAVENKPKAYNVYRSAEPERRC